MFFTKPTTPSQKSRQNPPKNPSKKAPKIPTKSRQNSPQAPKNPRKNSPKITPKMPPKTSPKSPPIFQKNPKKLPDFLGNSADPVTHLQTLKSKGKFKNSKEISRKQAKKSKRFPQNPQGLFSSSCSPRPLLCGPGEGEFAAEPS